MNEPPRRPPRPTTPSRPDYAADATGLNSLPVDPDAVDDLAALAASVAMPSPVRQAAIAPTARVRQGSSVRRTLIPLSLTGGGICIGLAIAWWQTDADSPYRRVSVALPIVLMVAGLLLLLAAAVNMLLVRRVLAADHATAGVRAN